MKLTDYFTTRPDGRGGKFDRQLAETGESKPKEETVSAGEKNKGAK